MSLINEGVDVDRLKEPTKRSQRMVHQESDDEENEEDGTEDVIDAIVKRFLTEQRSQEENTLKIEVVENSHLGSGEEEKISKYMMLARLQFGQPSDMSEPE